MNSFTKKLPLVISLISAFSLAGVTIHQSGVISELRINLRQKINKLTLTEGLLEAEMALTESLRNEKAVLEDSIEVLHVEVATLTEKITQQKSTISHLNDKVKKLDDNVASFSKQIAELKKQANTDLGLLRKVEAERDQALRKMEDLDRQRAKVTEEAAATERAQAAEQQRLELARKQKDKVETQLQQQLEVPRPNVERPAPVTATALAPMRPPVQEEAKPTISDRVQDQIRKVVTATAVDYHTVELKMQEGGSPLNKLKKNGWRYLTIGLNLTNPDAAAIADEEFIVQVFDLDNQQVVPINESNPQYPGSSQGAIGYRFKFEGQPMTLQYFNSQEKTGSNYELRIFYAKNNVLLPLKNGTLRIVEDGKVMR